MNQPDHSTYREWLNLEADGELSSVEQRRLDEHLAGCEGCAAYLDQLRTTIRLSGRLSEEAVPSEAMGPLLEAFRAWRRG